VARQFLADTGLRADRACFAVACPITDGECNATNLPWTFRARDLSSETGIAHVQLINDFQAVGHALAQLRPQDLVTLQPGVPTPRGPVALIGAGTGLGQAFGLWDGARYHIHPSEGGHTTFAARTDRERTFATALDRELDHVSYERVLSGPGLVNVYRHLARHPAQLGDARSPDGISAQVEHEGAKAVTRHALAGTDPVCVAALDFFASVYGAQAGNLALTVMATGGVYIAGGIAPHIVDKLGDGTFLAAFRAKGRLADVLERIPVHVIVNRDAGLLGAAVVAAHVQSASSPG
jgi:glucokinase